MVISATSHPIHLMYVRPLYALPSDIIVHVTVDSYDGRLETSFARYGS